MITRTIAELLEGHVSLDVEGMDRIYLNAYQPRLQTGGGVSYFFRNHRQATVASPVLMAPMSRGFVRAIERYAKRESVDLVRFKKGQRKDEVTQARLRDFTHEEGVLYIGVAQERFSTFRMGKRFDVTRGVHYPWLYRSPVMCNQYYFYVVDRDFGPVFIKFSSYFPYTGRVCLNGHEYAKRQLDKAGVEYEALDNGFSSCADPKRLQRVLDALDETKIERMVRKWMARLPSPFTREDHRAGYRYELSILQSEFARTQVFDRPLWGRHLFEEVIREHLDLGRPEQVKLIFDRRITKRTPGRFRTRIITEGVNPSLQVSYKWSSVKQYFKEGRALRTETTINNTRDFGIGRRLENLPALRAIGFSANRRLLEIEKLSQDCMIGEQTFENLTQPKIVEQQRVAALKFADPRVMALLQVLCTFSWTVDGFRNREVRGRVAALMGSDANTYGCAQMSYDLRRLRLHGLIEKIPRTHRYRVTTEGLRIALFLTKVHARVLRPGISQISDGIPAGVNRPIAAAMHHLDNAIEKLVGGAKLAA